jgi:hypothetical protein
MWIAIFGGLSPLRGPSATGSAEGENSETTLDDARASPPKLASGRSQRDNEGHCRIRSRTSRTVELTAPGSARRSRDLIERAAIGA